MLNEQQASQIVVNCIRAVSRVPVVSFNGTLDDADIIDANRVTRVISQIVNDPRIGVRSLLHRIAPNFFTGVGPSTLVDEVVGIVRDRSFPAPRSGGRVRLGAEKAAGKSKTARKGGAASKAGKKAAKKVVKKAAKKVGKKAAKKAGKKAAKKVGKKAVKKGNK